MIEANELRIGNWLSYDLGGIYEPRTVNPNDFSEPEIFKHASPISLSPEILEKAGFIKQHSSFRFDVEDCGFIEIEKDGSFGVGEDGGYKVGKWFASDYGVCKYVHQLQNLYFALTGEELTINL